MLKRLLLLSLSIFFLFQGMAQTPTTQGTDFWVSYMRNGHRGSDVDYDNCRLIVSAKEDGVVTVSNERANYSVEFPVRAGQVVMQTIPSEYAYNTLTEGKAYTGIHVTSTSVISLYIGNESHNSYDASNVLPVGALGTDYTIQTFNSRYANGAGHTNDIRASFLIIATEDGTTVDITPSATTSGNHSAGQTYTVELVRGQVYHVMTKNSSTTSNPLAGDFSGTQIVANKPIAVFNGNCLTAVPGGGNTSSGYDHVFEQAMPTDYWGKKFVVTSTRAPEGIPTPLGDDEVKVTAMEDHTVVTKNGNVLFALNAGESNSFSMNLYNEPCAYLEANNRIAVFLYNHSHAVQKDDPYGDPSMVWISPVEQTLEEVTFTTFNVQEVRYHFVNVVCYTDYCSEMTLDGTNISGAFLPVPGNSDLSYVRYPIPHSFHTLQCPGGFIAHVYGIGQAEGYAYTVGSSAKILTKQLYVDDILSADLPDGYTICQHDTVDFRVETNYEMHHVEWDFGDQQQGTGVSVSHDFAADGHFEVRSVIYRENDAIVQPFDTLSVMIHVHPVKEKDHEITTCQNTIQFEGESYDVPGHYDVKLETVFGCDSIVHLHLNQGEEIVWPLVPVIACEYYRWFDSLYTETNHRLEHRVQHAAPDGCDSLYILDLTIGNPPENPERQYESCDPYDWHGVLCEETDRYTCQFTTEEGCVYDSVLLFTLLSDVEKMMVVDTCEQYRWFDSLYQETNHHLEHRVSNASPGGCDSLYILDLTIHHPPENTERQYESCTAYEWHGVLCEETKHYTCRFISEEGCEYDSVLYFTRLSGEEEAYVKDTCDRYEWMGTVYDTPGTHVYHKEQIGEDGCTNHYQLTLTLRPSPPFTAIVGLSHVAVATNFWPGEYIYQLDDSTGLDPGSIHWELSGDPGWRLVPHGASCIVKTLGMGMGTLRAWTTGYSDCDKEVSMTIHCSGYAVDEGVSTPLECYPNPAKEVLFVKGDGIVEVVVYNTLGQCVKKVSANNDKEVRVGLDGLAPALYLLEVRTRHYNKTLLFSVIR